MAEAAPKTKSRKVFPQISASKLDLLNEAVSVLEENLQCSFVLLKITNSNAGKSANFLNSCFLEFVRSFDFDEQPAELKHEMYYFGDVFARGIEVIRNYLKDQTKLPERKAEHVALEKLINVVNKQEEIAKRLSKVEKGSKEEKETLWTIELIHHLLKELAVNPSYVIDCYSKEERGTCFCGEDITGQFGDCSIGNADVWHGSVDILLGHSQDIALRIVFDEDEDNTETKAEIDLTKYYSQILAETIVFALVQKTYNPQFENFLIPTVGISKKDLVFFLYEAEHDILLESSVFSLLQSYGQQQVIPYGTILALWLTINYQYFCTGITETMKTRGFTADFFKGVDENIKRVYLEELKIGGCRSQGSCYPHDYVRPIGACLLHAKRSKPYKPSSR